MHDCWKFLVLRYLGYFRIFLIPFFPNNSIETVCFFCRLLLPSAVGGHPYKAKKSWRACRLLFPPPSWRARHERFNQLRWIKMRAETGGMNNWCSTLLSPSFFFFFFPLFFFSFFPPFFPSWVVKIQLNHWTQLCGWAPNDFAQRNPILTWLFFTSDRHRDIMNLKGKKNRTEKNRK